MDFSQSIEFAFKRANLPKILTIVLVAVIIGSSILVASAALNTIWLALFIVPVLLGYSLFIQGYTISIIKSVLEGNETLPDVRLGGDMGRGAILFVAAIVYSIPMIIITAIFIAILVMPASVSTAPSDTAQPGIGMIALICGGSLVWFAMTVMLGFSLVVGQVRYAAENRAGALFNIGKNFGIVMSNLGKAGGFFFRAAGISIIFGILSSIILNVIAALFGGTTSQALFALEDGNFDDLSVIAMPLAIFVSIYYTISLAINLMSGVSIAHLMAGFGAELGYGTGKAKNDDNSGGTSAVLVILAVVVLFALIACATVTVLALLGPQVGDVFSEIIREME